MLKTVVFLLIFATQCISVYPNNKYEIRASWITTIGGLDWPRIKASSQSSIRKQKEELCLQLDFLKEANFNTVIFQTRLRGDVVYPSIYETFAESLTGHTGQNPGYDPLRFAIEECHKRGLEFHAWIVCIPIGNDRQIQLQGKNSLVRKKPELCKKFNGSWYLDPGNPGAATYLSGIIKEIVANYDVDGIHLDYIRYPENGKNFPDKSSFSRYGKSTDISQWRRNNITHIVRKIYSEVKSLKPWVKVSSSPIGKYNDTQRYSSHGWNAYDAVYQDAQGWLKEGIHDMVFPMMYFRKNQFYPFALDWQENKHGRWVVPGLGIYFLEEKKSGWQTNEVLRQIHFLRRNQLDGQAFFRNKFLVNNSKGISEHLVSRFYKHKAVVPPMVWQDSIAPSAPQKGKLNITNQYATLKWDTAGVYKKGGICYRVYSSVNYPVDINNALHVTSNNIRGNVFTYQFSHKWEKGLFWAVTSVDRYGNESVPLEINKPEDGDIPVFINKLPPLPKGCSLVIRNELGIELMKCTNQTNVPSKLESGVYLIDITDAYGNQKTATVIMEH